MTAELPFSSAPAIRYPKSQDERSNSCFMWHSFSDGTTIGQSGSEGGIILQDEEHPRGARVTLERTDTAPYAITCGIYGAMVHTVFAGSLTEVEAMYSAIKSSLSTLVAEGDEQELMAGIARFVEESWT